MFDWELFQMAMSGWEVPNRQCGIALATKTQEPIKTEKFNRARKMS